MKQLQPEQCDQKYVHENRGKWKSKLGAGAHLKGVLRAKEATKGRVAKIPTLAAPDITAA